MIRETINKAIQTQRNIIMEYSKDGLSSKLYQLTKINYKPDEEYICGTPINSVKELTFRVNRIINIELLWNDISDREMEAPASGLFLIACRADMHLEFELMKYNKGDKFWDLYLGSNRHYNGWVCSEPEAFHFVPAFTHVDDKYWKGYATLDYTLDNGYYIFAYTLRGVVEKNEENFTDIPYGSCYIDQEMGGIFYTLVYSFTNISIEELRIKNNVDILAYHHCMHFP